MDFFLLSPEGQDLHFPVNPTELIVQTSKRIETVNIINIGEVDFPNGDMRTGIRFSSFFPVDYDSGYCRYPDLPDPQQALFQLMNFQLAGKPVRLLITDSPINTLVLVTNVNYRPSPGGEPGDIYFDVEMRTWREVRVRTAEEVAAASVKGTNPQRPRTDTRPVPKVYVVKPGDSLYKIAKLQLGSGSKWRDLYEKNQSVVGPDPNLILPGQKLVMPV